MKRVIYLLVASVVACGGSARTSDDLFNPSDGGEDGASGDDGGDASADAAPLPDDAADSCFPNGAIPTAWKSCKNAAACVERLHQKNCCGTEIDVGINLTSSVEFARCEKTWAAHFPQCQCATGPTEAEDGNSNGTIIVECVSIGGGDGECRTRVK